METQRNESSHSPSTWDLCKALAVVSMTSFGGPAAQMTLLIEVFTRRNWLDAQTLKEQLAICKLLPGPVGTQYALCLARCAKNRKAAALGGLFYILPPLVILLAIEIAFVSLSDNAIARVAFRGMQGAAVYFIIESVRRLALGNIKGLSHILIALFSAVVVFAAPSREIVLILGFGFLGILFSVLPWTKKLLPFLFVGFAFFSVSDGMADVVQSVANSQVPGTDYVLWQIFIHCFKASALVFGTGFATLSVVQHDFIDKLQIITQSQFLDAMALGQMTPGPIVIANSLLGLWGAGNWGFVLATAGTFLPSFLNTLVLVPLVPNSVWQSRAAKAFIETAFPAIIGGLFAFVGLLAAPHLKNLSLLSDSTGGFGFSEDVAFALQFLSGIFVAVSLAKGIRKMPDWSIIPCTGVVVMLLFLLFQ